MRKIKKLAAIALTGAMALSMAACGGSSTSTTAASGNTEGGSTAASKDTTADNTQAASETKTPRHEGSEPRTIKIGTWYDIYYDSTHKDIHISGINSEMTCDTAAVIADSTERVSFIYHKYSFIFLL